VEHNCNTTYTHPQTGDACMQAGTGSEQHASLTKTHLTRSAYPTTPYTLSNKQHTYLLQWLAMLR
jgi:hypothetical protein